MVLSVGSAATRPGLRPSALPIAQGPGFTCLSPSKENKQLLPRVFGGLNEVIQLECLAQGLHFVNIQWAVAKYS